MYLTLKFLHIVGVILFLGNITTGVFWKLHADKSRDPRVISHALAGIVRADQLFTIPGVALILLGGFGAAIVGHRPLLRTAWLAGGIVLFVLTGLTFMARVAPLQRRMLALSRSANESAAFEWAAYDELSRAWVIWGSVALTLPAIAASLMVFKPTW